MSELVEVVLVCINLSEGLDLERALEDKLSEMEREGWTVIRPKKPIHRAVNYENGTLQINVRRYRADESQQSYLPPCTEIS